LIFFSIAEEMFSETFLAYSVSNQIQINLQLKESVVAQVLFGEASEQLRFDECEHAQAIRQSRI
jgi:hypothetical protein